MVWQPGQKLQRGKYEIIKVLGRGGFGITYHARHIQLNTEVVIKTPDLLQKKDIEYEQYVQQFQEEGQRLAKFSAKPHPHIVKVRDYFLEDTLPCLVMDFIRGQTLMEIIKTQGPLSEKQCLIYIRQVGKALETIHKAKMVHRDAHPGNIMIQDGEAILIDFGIAKNIIPATHSVTDKAANPSFAPYEQIYRGSKERQYTIDVYTLAATFYYAVTEKRPTPSMERKLNDKSVLIPPKQINRQLSEHINDAILEGMALEKQDRPQSISAWLGLLETPQPPPSVAPQYKQEVIKPKTPSKQKSVSKNHDDHKLTKMPWGSLITMSISCGVYTGILTSMSIPLLIALKVILISLISFFIVILILVIVGWLTNVNNENLGCAFALLLPIIFIIIHISIVEFSVITSIASGVLITIAVYFFILAEQEMEKNNISLIDKFLILSGVSLSGISLGYLIGWLTRL